MPNLQNSYEISLGKDPHIISIKCSLHITKSNIIKLPIWRPGRYEFGDFAKNIRCLKAYNVNGKEVKTEKISRNSWKLENNSDNYITINYEYFAKELNAGATFFNGSYLLINPINCLLYTDETLNLTCRVSVKIPKNWHLAGVPENKSNFELPNFDRLVDTPFIASPSLKILEFKVKNISFNLVIQGFEDKIEKQVINDFTKFCDRQLNDFSYFPTKRYEFIVISPDFQIYHGVEHLTSTIITLGPNKDLFKGLYSELLGVSSHELYHVWNVKSFRPKEMTPYKFDRENYSRFGFIYEGITTYLGDLYLLKSKVFTLEQYLKELNVQFEKHSSNGGRFNYSLGDSSIDTWIDGYVQGTPNRKVSIYTEGCLFAFLLDIQIIKKTKGKSSIVDFMRELSSFKLGYDLNDISNILTRFIGTDSKDFINKHINYPIDFLPILKNEISNIGLKFEYLSSKNLNIKDYGFTYKNHKNGIEILKLKPSSPLILKGILEGDVIEKINNKDASIPKNIDVISEDKHLDLTIRRSKKVIKITLSKLNQENASFTNFRIKKNKSLTPNQLTAFNKWIS